MTLCEPLFASPHASTLHLGTTIDPVAGATEKAPPRHPQHLDLDGIRGAVSADRGPGLRGRRRNPSLLRGHGRGPAKGLPSRVPEISILLQAPPIPPARHARGHKLALRHPRLQTFPS